MSQISQPGISNPEDKFVPAENHGALLLFFPTAVQSQVKTAHGDTDAVAATVVRLNDGRVYDNALIFPQALVTQLRGAVPDGIVLGTLAQGTNTKGNPPWLLEPFTPDQLATAEAWIAAHPRNAVAQPTAQQQAPAPAWGGQAPAAPAAQGWGQQAPPTQSAPAAAWGQQQPAPAPAAPATGGWGNPPAPAPQAATGGWGAPAPAAPAPAAYAAPTPAAPAVSNIHPDLVKALTDLGQPPLPGMTQEAAEQHWALLTSQPR